MMRAAPSQHEWAVMSWRWTAASTDVVTPSEASAHHKFTTIKYHFLKPHLTSRISVHPCSENHQTIRTPVYIITMADNNNNNNNNQESLLGGHAQYVKGATEVKSTPSTCLSLE
jgi:hypothetical protein